jgi:hypothetical protein
VWENHEGSLFKRKYYKNSIVQPMNEQIIKVIELSLIDGVVTDKEREVIFRKSKEFGVYML